jgi:hypothetical protein
MKRVLALVEGQTEERFVKDVLCPYLWGHEIDVTPTIAATKRVKRGPVFKGGITDYQKVENDLRRLLGDTGAVAVTTFIDYYGLPADFPGMASRPPGNPIQKAVHVETEWARQIAHDRFRPYLMVHEFEALLFSKPEELIAALHMPPGIGQTLFKIRESFSTPEEINDNPETAPSRRILQLSSAYRKIVDGPIVAKRIGLQVIRNQCKHFNAWLDWLETL